MNSNRYEKSNYMQLNQYEKQLQSTDWWPIVKDQFQMPYYAKLRDFLYSDQAYNVQTDNNGNITQASTDCLPKYAGIFNALRVTPFKNVKVVILGQDPYPTPGNPMGLSFSVAPGRAIPRSLQNVFIELHNDLGCTEPRHGCLLPWTKQGVLLLNTVMTVHANQSHSHKDKGWEQFTDHLIKAISNKKQPVVFILWGRDAKSKEPLINENRNFVLKSSHPSPYSAHYGFFGSRPFSKTNEALTAVGEKPINWQLPAQMTLHQCVPYFK